MFLQVSFGPHSSLDRLIFINITNKYDLGRQFKLLMTGEVDGISYANTSFNYFDSGWFAAGDRNDGSNANLPGITPGEATVTKLTKGLVYTVCTPPNCPRHSRFGIVRRDYDSSHPAIGQVIHGLEHLESAASYLTQQLGEDYAELQPDGPGSLKIIETGIVLY